MQTSRNQKTLGRLNFFITAAVLALLILYSFAGGGSATGTLTVGQDSLRLSAGQLPVIELAYTDIRSLQLTDTLDLSDFLEQQTEGDTTVGQWHSDALGDFTGFFHSGVTRYILVRTAGGLVAFNYSSDSATEGFYTAFAELLQQKGIL